MLYLLHPVNSCALVPHPSFLAGSDGPLNGAAPVTPLDQGDRSGNFTHQSPGPWPPCGPRKPSVPDTSPSEEDHRSFGSPRGPTLIGLPVWTAQSSHSVLGDAGIGWDSDYSDLVVLSQPLFQLPVPATEGIGPSRQTLWSPRRAPDPVKCNSKPALIYGPPPSRPRSHSFWSACVDKTGGLRG